MKRTFYQHGVAWERLQENERSRRAENEEDEDHDRGPTTLDLMLRAARGPLWPHPTKERRTQ
jgi:hypothetical protein